MSFILTDCPNRIPTISSNGSSTDTPCGSVVWDDETRTTADGPPREDASVLQAAVCRLLGYRWPAELDPDMELAPEQRRLADRCAGLQGLVDDDGLVAVPASRGEMPAADRLLDMLAASYGEEWSEGVRLRLLRAAGFDGKGLEAWLRDGFSPSTARRSGRGLSYGRSGTGSRTASPSS
jgi:hypothetical protein